MMRDHMRSTRGISDQSVPVHLGHLTFLIPLNYLGYGGIEKIDLKTGIRFEDARSGPIRFFLPDFSGLTPRRVNPRNHNDQFVQYNFGIRSYSPPREGLAQTPDLHDYGLEGFLANLPEAAEMSIEARRNKFGMVWVGKSVHGAEILISCNPVSKACHGFGKHPVGGYDYSFSYSLSDLPHWFEIEAGVHSKIMAWIAVAPK